MEFNESHYNSLVADDKLYDAMKYLESTIPKTIFKYYSLNDDNSLNNLKFESLTQGKMWLSLYNQFNDPFDFKAYHLNRKLLQDKGVPFDVIEKYLIKTREQFILTCGTSNLTDCMPMWAHYANNHKGFCVEYKVVNPKYLRHVIYTDTRIDITKVLVMLIAKLPKEIAIDTVSEKDKEWIRYMFYIARQSDFKHKTWSYENEIRVVYPNFNNVKDGELIDFEALGINIKSIYCGIRIEKKHRNRLFQICKENNVNFYEMVIDKHSAKYELKFKEVSDY